MQNNYDNFDAWIKDLSRSIDADLLFFIFFISENAICVTKPTFLPLVQCFQGMTSSNWIIISLLHCCLLFFLHIKPFLISLRPSSKHSQYVIAVCDWLFYLGFYSILNMSTVALMNLHITPFVANTKSYKTKISIQFCMASS